MLDLEYFLFFDLLCMPERTHQMICHSMTGVNCFHLFRNNLSSSTIKPMSHILDFCYSNILLPVLIYIYQGKEAANIY